LAVNHGPPQLAAVIVLLVATPQLGALRLAPPLNAMPPAPA